MFTDNSLQYVYCTNERYVIDPVEAVKLIDENTIGICAIVGTTYTGEYEDVKKINDLLVEKNIDVPIHVDAASGGFVAPFVNPQYNWDFRLEKVVSINVSGHKYGLVYPGVGELMHCPLNGFGHTDKLSQVGSCGDRPSSCHKSWYSPSTTWARTRHHSL